MFYVNFEYLVNFYEEVVKYMLGDFGKFCLLKADNYPNTIKKKSKDIRSWKNVTEFLFSRKRTHKQNKYRNVLNAFSPTLKWKTSECYKSLSSIRSAYHSHASEMHLLLMASTKKQTWP